MNHSGGFVKGMVTGLVVGAAVTMMTDPVTDKQRHRMKKKTNGMFKKVGYVLDNALDMMR